MKKLEVEELLEAQELKERISELLRLVEEEGETIEVTRDGEVITRLVPPARTSKQPVEQSDAAAWADLKQIASELAPNWPDKDVDAVEIVRDVRRDLPVNEPKQSPKRDVHAFWRRIDQLAAQVGTHVSEKVDAVKIVREGRREL